jgi:hypothetical protein
VRGVYTATYRIAAISAAKTLMYITAPTGAVVEILSARVTNESNETNEQLVACLQRVTSLGTPTATVCTPATTENGSSAAASTVKANVTASEPTYGASSQGADIVGAHGMDGFSSLGGWYYDPTPEERLYVNPGATIGLRLLSTPTSFDGVVRITFRELG